ncbi:hypothetical protein P43SY_003548 [Pythium insidiosum]|uniref:Uncharacterized protein n=1 Tax=Pythium insidiosum TaxID=114742 RepID=A0AAD5LH68_PYTIN|nr:hypothetical protein P43SY_003548 [Pythium insidiosum]
MTHEQPQQDLKQLEHQAAVVNQLIEHNLRLAERLRIVEAQLAPKSSTDAAHTESLTAPKRKAEDVEVEPPTKRARSSQTSLVDAWYDWYVGKAFESPSLSRQKKSELRQTIGFMRLFAGAYELRDGDAAYRDRVLETGASSASPKMPSAVPESDDPRTMRNFTAACVNAVGFASRRVRKIHLEAEVIRKLRSTMFPSIMTREALDEALKVVIDGIAQKVALDNAKKNVRYAYIRD